VDNELSSLKDVILLTKRGFLVIAFIFFIFFTSYAIFSSYIIPYIIPVDDNRQIIQASFSFIIAITAVLTSFFIPKINKLHAIYACSIFAGIATVLLCVSNSIFRLILVFGVGIFLGVGQLAFSTFFWNLTVPEERGRIGGLIGFVSLPFYFTMIVSAGTLDFLGTVAMLGGIISLAILAVKLLKPEKMALTAKTEERGKYSEKRTILLYSIPWVVFSLLNLTLAKNISLNALQQVSSSFYLFLMFLQIIGTVLGTVCGGMIADFFGRRPALGFAVTSYGISSALGGLIQSNAIYCFTYFANGLSWGIFLTLYGFVVWGDLANKENCAKMYSIGLLIYYLSSGVSFLPIQVSQIPVVISALASCILIFFSYLPIIVAPELLPSDFREKVKLRMHIRTLRKIEEQSRNQG